MGEKEMMKKVHNDESGDAQTDDMLTPGYEVWKPDRLNPVLSALSDEDKKTFYLRRKVISILNKLTPENFNKLVEKMKSLSIDTAPRMQRVVEIIHMKAINEWKFCGLYAELCNHMTNVTVIDEDESTKSFSLFLIGQCEKHFENSLVEDFKFDRKKASIDLCVDLEEKKKMLKEYELDEYMFRKRSVGNCRFIGELFKLYLINPKIIFLMLDKLFKHVGTMSIECSCALISTIGSFYEEKFEKFPQLYFEKIEELVQLEELPTRIHFMLQDILDLKKNLWRCRFQHAVPKTFAQIEREIHEEEMQTKLALEIQSSKPKDKSREKYHQTRSTSWTKLSTPLEKNIKKTNEKKTESMQNATSQESILSDSSSNKQPPETSSKQWLKRKDLQESCKRIFVDYIQQNEIQSTADSFKNQFVKNQIPKVICAFIQYVMENDSQNAGKCGEMLVGLIKQEVITTRHIVKGLSTLLSASEEQHIPADQPAHDLELILGPLFFENYLQLDDLNSIFKQSRNVKAIDETFTKKSKQEKCANESNESTQVKKTEVKKERSPPEIESVASSSTSNSSRENPDASDSNLVSSESKCPILSTTDSKVDYLKLQKEMEKLRQLEEENREQLKEQAEKVAQLFEIINDMKGSTKVSSEDQLRRPQKSTGLGSVMKDSQTIIKSRLKKYPRERLLEFRDLPQCTKPLKIPSICSIEHTLHVNQNMNLSEGNFNMPNSFCTFMPGIMNTGRSSMSFPTRKSQQGRMKNDEPTPINVALSLEEDVPLRHSNNACKPTNLYTDLKSLSSEEKKTQKLYKSVTDILNKLTLRPEKFNTLLGRIRNLPIDNIPRLQGVIDLIFEKAIDEPGFCKWYGEMCYVMQGVFVPDKETGKTYSFRTLLINKCQENFERDKAEELDVIKKQEEIHACTDPEKKKELQLLYEDAERKVRRKSVGNCRLIGEFFKLKMLTAKIMIRCIVKLSSSTDEESLECLCTLLTTIGKDLENKLGPGNKKELDSYFDKMQDLAENKKYELSSRIRSMLHDVIDLRKNNWGLRYNADCFKTSELRISLSDCSLLEHVFNKTSNTNSEGVKNVDNAPMHSADQLSRACATIYQEYESNNDLKYSVEAFEERFNPKQVPEAVQIMLSHMIENKPESAPKCGLLLANLIKRGTITKQHFINALKFLVDLSEDLIIDCPKLWVFLADATNPLIYAEDCLQISELETIFPSSPLLEHISNKPYSRNTEDVEDKDNCNRAKDGESTNK